MKLNYKDHTIMWTELDDMVADIGDWPIFMIYSGTI